MSKEPPAAPAIARRPIVAGGVVLLAVVACIAGYRGALGARQPDPNKDRRYATAALSPAARRQFDEDRRAIQAMIDTLDRAYAANLGAGLRAEAAIDYYVLVQRYTTAACLRVWKQIPTPVHFVMLPVTLMSASDWTDLFVGTPRGRVYAFDVRETVIVWKPHLQRSVATQQIHVTVIDHRAYDFYNCEPAATAGVPASHRPRPRRPAPTTTSVPSTTTTTSTTMPLTPTTATTPPTTATTPTTRPTPPTTVHPPPTTVPKHGPPPKP